MLEVCKRRVVVVAMHASNVEGWVNDLEHRKKERYVS